MNAPSSETALVDREARAPAGTPCPACGCPVEKGDHFCPACGTPAPAAVAGDTSLPPPRPSGAVPPSLAGESEPIAAEPIAGEPVAAEVVTRRIPPVGAAPHVPPAKRVAQEDESSASQPAGPPRKYLHCQSCGAEVQTDPNRRSYVCPFCDSTVVVEFDPRESGRQEPEFVIGFVTTPNEAQEKFLAWIADNAWFRPGDLPLAEVVEKLRGVYLPFWSFSMLAESQWTAEVGEHWQRTETYTDRDSSGNMVTKTRTVTETEWWPLAGNHHQFYYGHLVSGSRGLPQKTADRIMPFHLPALKRFEPLYLAGWECEEYSVVRQVALEMCQQEFLRREQARVAEFLPGDTRRHLNVQTVFGHVSSDLCLLPVYVLSYRYREKVYRFLINGQTGKMAGDKPVSWRRISLGCLGAIVLAVVLALVVNLLGRGGR